MSKHCTVCMGELTSGVCENGCQGINESLQTLKSGNTHFVDLSEMTKGEGLGQGGMGAVWEVSDKEGAQYALKLMLPELSGDEHARNTFIRESQMMLQLNHPNIVQAFQVGELDAATADALEIKDFEGSLYILMELCQGGCLQKRLDAVGGAFNIYVATDIILQVLDSLIYTHKADVVSPDANGNNIKVNGVVHRDLKPSNIFLIGDEKKPTVKIADFGLAKAFALAGLSGHTAPGSVAGSPAYMPRQQVEDFNVALPAVDVWASAACYYKMLTGMPPKELSDRNSGFDTPAIPIRKLNPKIPEELAKVIDHALIDNPDILISSASDFKSQILTALPRDCFPDWKPGRFLGRGSYGDVYEISKISRDVKNPMKSAMKRIRIDDTKLAEEAAKEVQTMIELKPFSEHIVKIEDHGRVPASESEGEFLLIRMELLTSLANIMESKSVLFDEAEVAKLGLHLCSILEECEKHSTIHRDIKPENIFKSESGNYKLGDFGIARVFSDCGSLLSAKGTRGYMAPEIYDEEAYCDSRVDIYSLGVTMYRLVNDNKMPFEKETPAYKTRLRDGHIPMPFPCNASKELSEIIIKACAHNRDERYATAKEMKLEIEKFIYKLREKDTESSKHIKEDTENTVDDNTNIQKDDTKCEAEEQFNKGQDYYHGRNGVKQNYEQAAQFIQQSASAGFAQGQYALAIMYRDGVGVCANNYDALTWAEMAADQSVPEAQYLAGELSEHYLPGTLGLPADIEDSLADIKKGQAAEWYRKAAMQGHAAAMEKVKILDVVKRAVDFGYSKIADFYFFAESNTLYRADVCGTNKTQLEINLKNNQFTSDDLTVAEDNNCWHGGDNKSIIDYPCVAAVNNFVYYLSKSNCLMKCDISGENLQIVFSEDSEKRNRFFNGLKNNNQVLYFQAQELNSDSKRYYKYSLSTGQIEQSKKRFEDC